MDKIIEKTLDLKENLDNLYLFKEYKRLKKIIEENEEINALKRDIVLAKKDNKIEEHKMLLDQYNNHPLIRNLEELENEVAEYLKEVSDILNK